MRLPCSGNPWQYMGLSLGQWETRRQVGASLDAYGVRESSHAHSLAPSFPCPVIPLPPQSLAASFPCSVIPFPLIPMPRPAGATQRLVAA